MKASTAPLTAMLAAAALIALPASSVAQSAPPSQPPTQQTPAQPPATTGHHDKALAPDHTAHAANQHLMQAKTALNGIQLTSVTGATRTKLTALKRHMASLERSVSAASAPAKGPQRSAPAWATHLAAVDKSLTDLTSPSSTTDDATRGTLAEVRTHISAFAAAMSGTATPTTTAPQPHEPKTSPKPDSPSPSSAQTPGARIDQEAARRHLTSARDTLSQLTQLPEAAQLTGEARTQVSQLITNFNELITTQTEWRASFGKVQSNLTALLGAERTDEPNVPPPATGTAGAIGTSGITTLDPKVREKLVEFRNKLVEFERASTGGGGSTTTTATVTPGTTTTATATLPTTEPAVAQRQQPTSHAHPGGEAGHTSALQHIAAIEAILNPPSTSGAAADVKMDRVQLDQIRTHLAELKKLLQQARRD